MKLLSKDADFAIMYSTPNDTKSDISKAFESVTHGADNLIPVCAPSLRQTAMKDLFPFISYPSEVFLGQVYTRMIAPRLPQGITTEPIAETALTLAML